MNRFTSLIILFLIFIPTAKAWSSDELPAIKQTALNYMESWYQGDAKKMKANLHKKLAKRSLQYGELKQTKASSMVAWTRDGVGRGLWRDDLNIEVIVLDYYKNIASVKVITPHYYEFLHLMKTDKKWVIINALYESKSPTDD